MIKDFSLGLIPFASDYFSPVKLFMYGAAKLAVVLPKAKNFRNIFTEDEVLFIENGSAEDIANKLNIIGEHPGIVQQYGEKLYLKVANNFTWERIYFDVS